MTCPIEQTLIGCQSTPLGAFVADDGQEVWSNDGVDYLGTILWCEEWLYASMSHYQRVYLFDHTPGHGPGGGGGGGTPGATCPAAMVMTLDVDYDFFVGGTDENWFKFPVTSGTQYTVHLTCNTGLVAIATGNCGSVCPGADNHFVLGAPLGVAMSTSFTPSSTYDCMFFVAASGGADYTVKATSP